MSIVRFRPAGSAGAVSFGGSAGDISHVLSSNQAVRGRGLPDAVRRWLAEGDYVSALGCLRTLGHDRDVRDTLGVCLMRSGRVAEALALYRQLVLQPGCTWTRVEVCDRIKRNFATSLVLSGLPSGGWEVLDETKDRSAPRAVQLRAAIGRWAAGLPWWRRLLWRLGNLEPADARIALDFVPGEWAIEVSARPNDFDRPLAA